jgi:oxygen-dependent protoporphyrinogen oxidase
MIGKLDPKFQEVTIIGGGISGLLCAYYLDRHGWKVELIEASSRTGGLLSSEKSALGLSESAAHSLRATPKVKEHFEQLGLKLLPLQSKDRFILKKNKPRKFPLTFFQALRTAFCAYFRLAPKADPESLDFAQWSKHFLGESAYRYLITPFTRGIFGAEPDHINVSASFPGLCVPRGHSLLSFFLAKKLRKNPPNVVRRKVPPFPGGPTCAPENGMGDWVRALTEHLEKRLGDRLIRGQQIDSLSGFENRKNLILAVPAHEAADLISPDAQEMSSLSMALAEVSYSPMVSTTVFVEQKNLSVHPRGLGVLVPAIEGKQSLGILYNSSSFQNRAFDSEIASFTVMLGGSGHPEVLKKSDSEIRQIITLELGEIFGLQGDLKEVHIHRWEKAIPQYNEHLLGTWELAWRTWCSEPGRVLFGNYTGQISLRGMLELASGLGL